jgi:hypothetical protein
MQPLQGTEGAAGGRIASCRGSLRRQGPSRAMAGERKRKKWRFFAFSGGRSSHSGGGRVPKAIQGAGSSVAWGFSTRVLLSRRLLARIPRLQTCKCAFSRASMR